MPFNKSVQVFGNKRIPVISRTQETCFVGEKSFSSEKVCKTPLTTALGEMFMSFFPSSQVSESGATIFPAPHHLLSSQLLTCLNNSYLVPTCPRQLLRGPYLKSNLEFYFFLLSKSFICPLPSNPTGIPSSPHHAPPGQLPRPQLNLSQ